MGENVGEVRAGDAVDVFAFDKVPDDVEFRVARAVLFLVSFSIAAKTTHFFYCCFVIFLRVLEKK